MTALPVLSRLGTAGRPGELGAPLLVAAVVAGTVVLLPNLYAGSSTYTLSMQAAILGLVTLGQMLTMLVRGIDLSVNAVMALGVVLVVQGGSSVPTAVGLGLAIGLAVAVGVANGLLVTRRRVPPFIATLGTLIFVDGARFAYSHGQARGEVPDFLRALATQGAGPIPWAIVICVAAGVAIAVVLHRTALGRWVYAAGSNPEAARLSGVPVDRVVVLAYVASSLLALVAGLVLSGYINYVDHRLADGYNLESITAAVVGGTSFLGGRGSPHGALAGAVFLTLLVGIVIVAGLAVQLQYVAVGLVLIGALVLQQVRIPALLRAQRGA